MARPIPRPKFESLMGFPSKQYHEFLLSQGEKAAAKSNYQATLPQGLEQGNVKALRSGKGEAARQCWTRLNDALPPAPLPSSRLHNRSLDSRTCTHHGTHDSWGLKHVRLLPEGREEFEAGVSTALLAA